MKNDRALGKQSQYPLLHEANTQSNSVWWLWRSTWTVVKHLDLSFCTLREEHGWNEVSVAIYEEPM